jgi:hypothetical protein
MEQSPPWEANIHSASHETPYIVWNSEVLYIIHNSPMFPKPYVTP